MERVLSLERKALRTEEELNLFERNSELYETTGTQRVDLRCIEFEIDEWQLQFDSINRKGYQNNKC